MHVFGRSVCSIDSSTPFHHDFKLLAVVRRDAQFQMPLFHDQRLARKAQTWS
jgi:hypothetical protein